MEESDIIEEPPAPSRYFHLGWVVNRYYGEAGVVSWQWTQTNGTTVPLDLSDPPSGSRLFTTHFALMHQVILICNTISKTTYSIERNDEFC